MTKLLQQAMSEVDRLPEPHQDAIARMILDELADEQRWLDNFARSQGPLQSMADKVRRQIQAGRLTAGGFDQL
jgi:hypothetical protein